MEERWEWEEEREKQSSLRGREKMQDEGRLERIQLHLKKRCGLWWPVWSGRDPTM